MPQVPGFRWVATALLWNSRTLADAIRAGDLKLTGDRATAERFLRLFPLPRPATSDAER